MIIDQHTKGESPVCWRIVYTRPKYEKKAHKELQRKGVKSFLPLQKQLRCWSDRKKWIEVPLFLNYIFVNIAQSERFNVLNTTGIINFVTFDNQLAEIPEEQIRTIKNFLSYLDEAEVVNECLEEGDSVEIVRGSLMGLQGELVSYKGKKRVAIRIEHLNKSILIQVAPSNLRKCS